MFTKKNLVTFILFICFSTLGYAQMSEEITGQVKINGNGVAGLTVTITGIDYDGSIVMLQGKSYN